MPMVGEAGELEISESNQAVGSDKWAIFIY